MAPRVNVRGGGSRCCWSLEAYWCFLARQDMRGSTLFQRANPILIYWVVLASVSLEGGAFR